MLQKALSGRKTQHEIATEFGVGKATIQDGLRHYRNNGDIKLKSKEKRPKDWTLEERISALIKTGAMTPEQIQRGVTGHVCAAFRRYMLPEVNEALEATKAVEKIRKVTDPHGICISEASRSDK